MRIEKFYFSFRVGDPFVDMTAGHRWIPRPLTTFVVCTNEKIDLEMPPDPCHLSAREREVLARLLKGKSEIEIAEELFLAKGTVHKYVMKLYREFGVKTRAELMALWIAAKGSKFVWEPKNKQSKHDG